MAQTTKQQYWTEQLQRAQDSGLSLVNYARLNNLSPTQLYQWRSTLKKQNASQTAKATEPHHFTQVVSTVTPSIPLTLQLGNAQLQFGTLPDPDWIVALLAQAHKQ